MSDNTCKDDDDNETSKFADDWYFGQVVSYSKEDKRFDVHSEGDGLLVHHMHISPDLISPSVRTWVNLSIFILYLKMESILSASCKHHCSDRQMRNCLGDYNEWK